MKKRYAALLCLCVVTSVLVLKAPAAWLAPLLKHYSQGTVSFAHSWGTVWHGSALIKLHRSDKEVLSVPQPLAWTLDFGNGFSQILSNLVSAKTTLELSSAALQAPVRLQLDGRALRVAAGQYSLPADSLNTAGAPFNTLKSSGQISLRWAAFELNTASNTVPAMPLNLSVKQLRMGLTGDDVLGDYQLDATPSAGNRWAITLSTSNPTQAALLLKGSGQVGLNSPPQFELESKAASAQASQRLQTVLNFLGRRQGEVYVLKIN